MVYNTLDVLGAALALGIPLKDSAAVLAGVPHVQGGWRSFPRRERIIRSSLTTPTRRTAWSTSCRTVKEFAKGRTVAVFGCGGDRDRTKRPLMGKAAADWSDFAVVTTDNPRTEQPEAIIEEILPGLCRQCNALSGGGGPGGGHPLGHGPCTEGGRHRSVPARVMRPIRRSTIRSTTWMSGRSWPII